MRVFAFSAVVLATVPACAWPVSGNAVVLTADTAQRTASGETFTGPGNWSVSTGTSVTTLTAPERDTRIAIVHVGRAASGAAAVASAWHMYRPDFARPVRLVTPRVARNGWEERLLFDYESSPNEQVVVQAVAIRAGTTWTVLILDGTLATTAKRGAAVGLVFQSLQPAGYAAETFAGRAAHRLDATRIERMRAFVASSLAELGVPGASFALYDHGRVVFEGGVGVKAVGSPDPVDARTLFMVASNTKGMSTLLLSKLVDAGRLRWDQPVAEVYPAFRLGSEATTRQVLVRHLVCACTGLPRKDFDWMFNTPVGTPAARTFTLLAATEPTSGFGEVYQYNNLMASAAGYIGGLLYFPDMEPGAAYDRAMQENVFRPLGMTDTTFDMAKAQAGNHARPHGNGLSDTPQVASMDFNQVIVPYRPAGGVWSSAHDMIRYVENELRQGTRADGERLFSASNLLARRIAGVPTGNGEFYGMGLRYNTLWGVPVVHHGGSLAGYKSDIIFLPEADVGAVILTNADNGEHLLGPFMRRLLELLYDGKPEAQADVANAALRSRASAAEFRRHLSFPPAAAPTQALAATYSNPDLGRLSVQRQGSGVVFRFAAWSSAVASRANDDGTTSFVTVDPTIEGFQFVVATRGGKRALVTRDGQHEYAFVETG